MTKFFKFPFAVSGDTTAIPNLIQVSGSVSYEEGFGLDYQRNLLTDPLALPIPRGQFNQLMNDVTLNIQQYQTMGTPNFISTSDNGGTAYSYNQYARVLYLGKVYESLVNSNTALPTDTTKWQWITSSDNSAVIYSNVAFEGTVVNGNAVYWNNGASNFAKAIAGTSPAQDVVGIADVTNKRVYAFGLTSLFTGLTPGSVYYLSSVTAGAITATRPGSGLAVMGVAQTSTTLFLGIVPIAVTSTVGLPPGTSIDFRGDTAPLGFIEEDGSALSRTTYANLQTAITTVQPSSVTSGSPLVTGLTTTAKLFAGIPVEGVGIAPGTTILTVTSGTTITLSANATTTGTPNLTFFRYGNGDGSTTFNIPDSRRMVSMGAGGTVVNAIVGGIVGQSGGEEFHALTADENGPHLHTLTVSDGDGTEELIIGTSNQLEGSVTTGSSGLGNGHNNIQPTLVVTKCIKY